MLENLLSFILKYKLILIFYLVIIALVIWKRKKLEFQAKIIVLYRSKFGLGFIERLSQKHRSLVVLLGYIGVGAGYIGLVLISYVLVRNLWDLFTKPETVSGVSLVLPGINIPGMGVLPFWYWILSIFVIALVHEFAHGVVARANNLEVKNTGLVLFGPIVGAFVEPNEKKLKKADDIKQYSVLAAGSFSNILLALVALLLLNFAFLPLQQTMVEPTGWSFGEYYGEDFPAAKAGLPPETPIIAIDGEKTSGFIEFNEKISCLVPGDQINLDTAEGTYSLVLADSPNDPGKPFLGVSNIQNEFSVLEGYRKGFWHSAYYLVSWIVGLLKWLFLLSLGIGLFNLLPLPIVDGGRMLQVYFHRWKGKDKGERYYRRITMFFLTVLLLNLFFPLLKRLFGL